MAAKRKTPAKKKAKKSEHVPEENHLVKPPKKKINIPPKKKIILPRDGMELSPEIKAKMRAQHDWPWKLRPYQQKAYDAFEAGKRRQGLFWHRRAGKDVFCLSMARKESQARVGGYVHFFPKHVQAKRAIWNGIDPKKGARFIDTAFSDIEVSRNNTDMFMELHNGSTWQLLGSDNYDRIVGGNLVGAFFSEWALCDPRAWDFIRPIIRENDGFVFFITTFRGRNHAWQMAQNLKKNEDWHIDIMTVDQSRDIEGNYIISPEDIEKERADGMTEALIQQEYFCNPDAVMDGAIYGTQVTNLRNDPARQMADWNPALPVDCIWHFDLPMSVSYTIIQPGERPAILMCEQMELITLGEAIAKVNQERWPIQKHHIMATQRDMIGAMIALRVNPTVLPLRNEYQATTNTAAFLERVRIDGERCEVLLEALSGYMRRERFDSQVASIEFSPDPIMSWHSRIANPLECYASLDYDAENTWGAKINYAASDRANKTVV